MSDIGYQLTVPFTFGWGVKEKSGAPFRRTCVFVRMVLVFSKGPGNSKGPGTWTYESGTHVRDLVSINGALQINLGRLPGTLFVGTHN